MHQNQNFFCHAAYGSDDQARLTVAHSIILSDSDEDASPIRDASRPLDRANMHEIVETARRLADLNAVLWELVSRLEDALQVPLAKRHPKGTPVMSAPVPRKNALGNASVTNLRNVPITGIGKRAKPRNPPKNEASIAHIR